MPSGAGLARLVWIGREGKVSPLVDRLRLLDRRPGPWPMERTIRRSLDEMAHILATRPESLVQPESLGDPGSRWESASEQDLRAEGCLRVWDRVPARRLRMVSTPGAGHSGGRYRLIRSAGW